MACSDVTHSIKVISPNLSTTRLAPYSDGASEPAKITSASTKIRGLLGRGTVLLSDVALPFFPQRPQQVFSRQPGL